MNQIIKRSTVIWALEELSSRDEQIRLWLSDGSSGEVSSFTEAICVVFDGGVSKELESGRVDVELQLLFDELGDLIAKIPTDVAPQEVIDHPQMNEVRRVSHKLIQQLRDD